MCDSHLGPQSPTSPDSFRLVFVDLVDRTLGSSEGLSSALCLSTNLAPRLSFFSTSTASHSGVRERKGRQRRCPPDGLARPSVIELLSTLSKRKRDRPWAPNLLISGRPRFLPLNCVYGSINTMSFPSVLDKTRTCPPFPSRGALVRFVSNVLFFGASTRSCCWPHVR